MLLLMTVLKRILVITISFLVAFQLAACGIATPASTVTAIATIAPNLTSIIPSTTSSPISTITLLPDDCNLQGQDEIQVISGLRFTALEPGNPVEFDRILVEQDQAWADFQQGAQGEMRSAGVIFHETAAGPEWGTGVNPAVILVIYGVERNWELPTNDDLVSEVDRIRAELFQHRSDWVHEQVDQSQYPAIANAATYALYRYFNGDLSKLKDWCRTYVQVYGESPLK